jgi:CheY-like chemotaxis protein
MENKLNKTVLVVDDEDDVRNYLVAALEDAGFNVRTAVDGLDALEKVRKNKPDMISLDLVMPKHSGSKFYFELQKDKDLKSIPVLIVTGHARDELGKVDFDTMTMQGPGVYLEKPVNPKKYVATVCKLLNIDAPKGFEVDEEQYPDMLRNKLTSSLRDADPEALKRALEALNKK